MSNRLHNYQDVRVRHGRPTFAEHICSQYGRSTKNYTGLAWKHGANWPTRLLRPLILIFAPRYFEAEDLHLERAADCRSRHEIVEELGLMRVSYLRRGGWRYLGIGVNGKRLLRHYDSLVTLKYLEDEAKRASRVEPGPGLVAMDKREHLL